MLQKTVIQLRGKQGRSNLKSCYGRERNLRPHLEIFFKRVEKYNNEPFYFFPQTEHFLTGFSNCLTDFLSVSMD
jgi:hypothetical protein